MHRPTSSSTPRGFSLIECMIALTVLAVGLVALWHVQVFALYSDAGARASVRAQELAHELAAALLRLDQADARLAAIDTGAMPAHFGQPLDSSTVGHWRTYGTGDSLPGVTPTASIERDPLDSTQPLFKRMWSVWQLDTANPASAIRLVAIAVVYHEKSLVRPRAVTLWVQVANPGAATINAAAYR